MKPALFVTLFGRTLIQRVIQIISAGGSAGAVYDPSDLSTLFQDAAGTTPVTASGQPVRLMRDKSGSGFHATAPSDAARPVYTEAGGLRYLACDGASSAMVTGNIDLTGTDRVTYVAAVRKLSDALVGTVAEFSASSSANNGSFTLFAPGSGTAPDFLWRSKGTNLVSCDLDNNFPSPLTTVLSAVGNISGDVASLRVNRVLVKSVATDQGTGNYGNHAMYLFARAGTSAWFNGNFYGAALSGRPSGLTDSELTILESWAALKAGVP